jgi:hypothetical protein
MEPPDNRSGFADRVGHVIVVVGIPAASVWAIGNGAANQWTWLSLVSVLWYLKNDRVYADAIRAISSSLSARFSSGPGKE